MNTNDREKMMHSHWDVKRVDLEKLGFEQSDPAFELYFYIYKKLIAKGTDPITKETILNYENGLKGSELLEKSVTIETGLLKTLGFDTNDPDFTLYLWVLEKLTNEGKIARANKQTILEECEKLGLASFKNKVEA